MRKAHVSPKFSPLSSVDAAWPMDPMTALKRARRSAILSRAVEPLEPRRLLSNYTIQDLGTLGGSASEAHAINATGEVVGSAQLSSGFTHATLWAPGQSAKDLGTLGGTASNALAINVLGQIIGKANSASTANLPFSLQPGASMTDITNAPNDNAGSKIETVNGVSDTGVFVGKALFNEIDLFAEAGYSFDPASGVFNSLENNNSPGIGEMVGVSGNSAVGNFVSSNISHAEIADVTTFLSSVNLPAIPSQLQSFATGVDVASNGVTRFATGYAQDSSGLYHAVLWTINGANMSFTDLGSVPGGPSATGFGRQALAVNSGGIVVGQDVINSNNVAFVWDSTGGMQDLNSLIPKSAISLKQATGINDSGQICATGVINGQSHAFLLTPKAAAPPQAKLTSAPNVSTFGGITYALQVTYTGSPAIDVSTLDNADILVTGPKGFSQLAKVATKPGANGSPAVVTYTIVPPGGSWDFSDDGTYNVTLQTGQVKLTNGTALTGGLLGHFVVAVAPLRGSISGQVFNDANANGVHDAGEGGVASTFIYIDTNKNGQFDAGERNLLADASGNYSFGGLLPDNYHVLEDPFAPHSVTAPQLHVQIINLSEGQNVTGADFGDIADPQIQQIVGFPFLGRVSGKTPQFDQPGTLLHIFGTGFVPGDVFFFGNDQGTTSGINLVADTGIQSFGLRIPKYATTGALVVLAPNGRKTTLLPLVTVDSYRNVNGYSFVNNLSNLPDFSFDELSAVYGDDQTHISVDPASDLSFGIFSDPINTGIPNPLAYAELAIINHFMGPNAGLCLGFSLSSTRLSLGLGDAQIDDFATQANTDGSTVWDLAGPAGPSPDLLSLIRLAHLEQTSAETLGKYLQQITLNEALIQLGHNNVVSSVKGELANGRPSIIALSEGGTSGHAVLCYNVEDGPNGQETLDIYDPNNPFDVSEEAATPGQVLENGTQHKTNVDLSTIVFDSNGNWSYANGDATGGMGGIAALPLSTFDDHTILASISGIEHLVETFVFGSAKETQVTDSSGHTLLNPDGTPNTNPNTKIPNSARYVVDPSSPPIDLFGNNGNFMQTIVGSGNGSYGSASMSTDAIAMISGVSTAKGQTDRFGLNPANDMMTFIPAVNKPITVDLVVNAVDGITRDALLNTTATAGAAQQLQFLGTNHDQVMVHNAGGAGMFSLTLSAASAGKVQSFSTGRVKLAAGDTLSLLPSDWTGLENSTATALIKHTNGTSQTMVLKNVGVGANVAAQEATSFSGPVATFINLAPAGISASIDWGDGSTPTAGKLVASGTGFVVSGTHTYAKQGYFPTRITISDSTGKIGAATGQSIVKDTKFTLASTKIAAFAGLAFTGRVATLTDLPSGDVANDFTVSINWGDGSTSAGQLHTTATGKFDVIGTHTWSTTGVKSVVITVTETGGATASETLKIGANKTFTGTVAKLQVPIPGSAASDYVGLIDWGDGHSSAATLSIGADGFLAVNGTHVYATGNKTFVAKITITGGPKAKVTSTATVAAAVSTISGIVFNDANANDVQDAGELGLSGRTVFVDKNKNGQLDGGEISAITNSSGAYTLVNVPAGTDRIANVLPAGWRLQSPAAQFYDEAVTAGQAITKLNFANSQLALLSGTVFNDANGNKAFDGSETGLANWSVYLDSNSDGVHEASEPVVLTDATGFFHFDNVGIGTYTMRVEPQLGWHGTTPAAGGITVSVGHGSSRKGNLFGEKAVKLAFAKATTFATAGAKPVALVVADFNNDKKPDVATADSTGNDVTIFLGKGDGTFAAGKKITVGKNPVGIVAGDFSGDGKIDLAIAEEASNKVQFLIGNNAGGFTLSPTELITLAPSSIATGDFDGDKRPDLVVTNVNSRKLTVFMNEGDGGAFVGTQFSAGSGPSDAITVDVNGDKKLDIVAANGTGGSVDVLLGDGKGGFATTLFQPALIGNSGVSTVAAADFDLDGSIDLLATNPNSGAAAILFGDGKGNFGPPNKVTTGASPAAVVAADFNGDGMPDAATVNTGATATGNKVAILVGKGDGTFLLPAVQSVGSTPVAVAVADLNGDGLLDVLAAVRDGNQLAVLLNKTT